MGLCEGCGDNFIYLAASICQKCKKIEQEPSEIQREVIKKFPQCEGCSVVYPHLKGPQCGACVTKNATEPDEQARSVAQAARAYQKTATELRLNQKPSTKQNTALQTATAVKERLSNLKKQNKAEIIHVDMMLFIYPHGGAAAKKAQLLPLLKVWNGSDSAKDALEHARFALMEAYLKSPARQPDARMINFEDVTFGISQTNKAVYLLEATECLFEGTLDEMFNTLKADTKLSESDIKARRISLRVYVYEVPPDFDSDDDTPDPVPFPKSRQSVKRKASSTNVPSPARYVSGFRPRQWSGTKHLEPELEYDTYLFTRVYFSIDHTGTLAEHDGLDNEEKIEVARDWQKDIGNKPKGGYISKGLSKYAFIGRLNGVKYAIFQSKPMGAVESQNRVELIAELRLLTYAQYFAKSFRQRSEAYGYIPPNGMWLRWNTDGAFVGTAVWCAPAQPDKGGEDNRSLLFDTFLAAPFISMTGLDKERKFSGNDQAGVNVDDVGRMVDAFAHHVFIDSNGHLILSDIQGVVKQDKSVILFDPQAHSSDQSTGYWDNGVPAMRTWLQQHKCNLVCKKLELHKAQIEIRPSDKLDVKPDISTPLMRTQGPLRHGFESAQS